MIAAGFYSVNRMARLQSFLNEESRCNFRNRNRPKLRRDCIRWLRRGSLWWLGRFPCISMGDYRNIWRTERIEQCQKRKEMVAVV